MNKKVLPAERQFQQISRSLEKLEIAIRKFLICKTMIKAGAADYNAKNGIYPSGSCDGLLVDSENCKTQIVLTLNDWKNTEERFLETIGCEELTPQERTAMILRYLEEKSDLQIQEETGYQNVNQIIETALNKLGYTNQQKKSL